DLELIWNAKTSRSEGPREQQLLAHCRDCSPCAEMLGDYEDVHREIDSLKDLGNTSETPCPSMDQWIKLAAGVLDREQAMQMLKHACTCRQCSQALTQAQGYVADDAEPLAGLESATPEWQRAVARQMAAQPPASTEKKSIFQLRWLWMPAAAAVA